MARLFVLTVFVYPVLLALLCVGAGLLVNRCSGRFLPTALLPSVGAAALIGLSQLSTYAAPLASATPYLMAAIALAGFALSRARVLALIGRVRSWPLPAIVPTLAYLFALLPVLLSGRPSFSSYMALADSAVHLIGADFLIHHGQDYSHLDLRSSYGLFINNYYDTSYPSGADTLFGGSALLVRLPLIWSFQPFNAFMLALASCPAWLLARRSGLTGVWAALAALTATVPALVYGYELLASVKEVAALSMILTLGALVVCHRRWLCERANRAIPFALVLAAGASALGVGFGAWALAAVTILLVVVVGELRARRTSVGRVARTVATGAFVALVAAWPTWVNFSQSLNVTQNIAASSNPGNLHSPLSWTHLFGVWLRGSYKQTPTGFWLVLTDVLVVVTILACLLGAFHLLRIRRYALAGWIALMLVVWLALSRSASTWVGAKTLMITSPVLVLLAWAGVAALRSISVSAVPRTAIRLAVAVLALAITGGVIASDLAQYHGSNLAPTSRYDELASINDRFAGRGPALFTDFDEYSLYELRDLNVSGANFVYPPPALAGVARGYGYPVDLNRVSPVALRSYPLIITRRDPTATPPPSAYRLGWQGRYYEAWERRPGAPAAILNVGFSPARTPSCERIERVSRLAAAEHARLIAAVSPQLINVPLAHLPHPAGWGKERAGLAMRRAGRLRRSFTVPRPGTWELWLQGQFMPAIGVSIDGRQLTTVSGELAGNSLVPDTITPVPVRLSQGVHTISVTRPGFSAAPGSGGSAVLDSIFLTPGHTPARSLSLLTAGGDPRVLCGRSYYWIELTRG